LHLPPLEPPLPPHRHWLVGLPLPHLPPLASVPLPLPHLPHLHLPPLGLGRA